MQQARDGLRVMRKIGRPRIETSYPAGLPRGGGQEGYTYQDNPLYGQTVMLKGHIFEAFETEFTAADTPVQLGGFWRTDLAKGLKLDVTGRVTYVGDGRADLTAQVSLRCTGGAAYTFRLYRNGEEELSSTTVTLTSAASDVSLSAPVSDLEPGEYLGVWVENDDDTTALTALSGQIEVS